MECKLCNSNWVVKSGNTSSGNTRWFCRSCGYRFSENSSGRPQLSISIPCPYCGSGKTVKNGKNSSGNQIWKCNSCGKRGVFSNFNHQHH